MQASTIEAAHFIEGDSPSMNMLTVGMEESFLAERKRPGPRAVTCLGSLGRKRPASSGSALAATRAKLEAIARELGESLVDGWLMAEMMSQEQE